MDCICVFKNNKRSIMRDEFGIAFTVELGRVNECVCVCACVCVCSVSWQEVFIQNKSSPEP